MKISNSILSLLLAAAPAVAFVPGAPRASLVLQRTNNNNAPPLHALPPQTPEVAKEAVGDMITFFGSINEKLSEGFQSELGAFLESIATNAKELSQALTNNPALTGKLTEVTNTVNLALQNFIAQHPSLQPTYETVKQQVEAIPLGNLPAPVLGLLSSVVTYTVVSSLLSVGPPPRLRIRFTSTTLQQPVRTLIHDCPK